MLFLNQNCFIKVLEFFNDSDIVSLNHSFPEPSRTDQWARSMDSSTDRLQANISENKVKFCPFYILNFFHMALYSNFALLVSGLWTGTKRKFCFYSDQVFQVKFMKKDAKNKDGIILLAWILIFSCLLIPATRKLITFLQ